MAFGMSDGIEASIDGLIGRDMKSKTAWILCAGFSVILLFVVTGIGNHSGKSNRHEPVMVEPGSDCLAEGEVLNDVQKLSGGRYSDFEQVRELFLKDAERSPRCRENIIAALMNAMKESDPDYKRDSATYHLWADGSQLLGELKAVEALDLLISHLRFTFGSFSSSMRHQPVLKGVIKMGEIAIPKLTIVLRDNPDPHMRMNAVFCLSKIGGQSAMIALKETLPSESNKYVSQFISVVIKAFDNKHLPNQITSKDQEEWFSAFHFCSE
jgi:hypothetical protein